MALDHRRLVLLAALASPFAPLLGQTDYYNLDAGHFSRIEDALPAERFALELMLAGLRLDRLTGGVQRWRTEPKIAYGVLPFTELEVRVPVIHVVPPGTGGKTSTGIGGIGIGALHTFNLETSHLPAVALSSEVVLPIGKLSAPEASYAIKALLTRTTRVLRVHLNGVVGTYAVRSAPPPGTGCPTVVVDGVCRGGELTPVPIDIPCVCGPITPSSIRHTSITASRAAGSPRSKGNRWLVGIGADRTWPLRSVLLSGNLYAERFVGLYPLTDWTAEIGARHQLTPWLIVDAGVGRRFAGSVQSSSAAIGLTYVVATRRFF
jgi:hypothetical protein